MRLSGGHLRTACALQKSSYLHSGISGIQGCMEQHFSENREKEEALNIEITPNLVKKTLQVAPSTLILQAPILEWPFRFGLSPCVYFHLDEIG